jgi:O-acetyl-ADP-ribose deacetylase (regulator of RNase III)
VLARLAPRACYWLEGALEIVVGDITADDSELVVNPVASLRSGGGLVDLSLRRVAGPELARAREAAASGLPVDAVGPVLTPGFGLRARHVAHVVLPAFANRVGAARDLEARYREAVEVAHRRGLSSVAFPSMGTGTLGYPLKEAAPLAVTAVARRLATLTGIRARFVLFGPATFDVYVAAARAWIGQPSAAM